MLNYPREEAVEFEEGTSGNSRSRWTPHKQGTNSPTYNTTFFSGATIDNLCRLDKQPPHAKAQPVYFPAAAFFVLDLSGGSGMTSFFLFPAPAPPPPVFAFVPLLESARVTPVFEGAEGTLRGASAAAAAAAVRRGLETDLDAGDDFGL